MCEGSKKEAIKDRPFRLRAIFTNEIGSRFEGLSEQDNKTKQRDCKKIRESRSFQGLEDQLRTARQGERGALDGNMEKDKESSYSPILLYCLCLYRSLDILKSGANYTKLMNEVVQSRHDLRAYQLVHLGYILYVQQLLL